MAIVLHDPVTACVSRLCDFGRYSRFKPTTKLTNHLWIVAEAARAPSLPWGHEYEHPVSK